jgi:hypothetical protein
MCFFLKSDFLLNNSLMLLGPRIIHRILGTNTFLYKIKVKDCNLCTFCKEEPETIKHLQWWCHKVSDLWHELSRWIFEMTYIDIPLNLILYWNQQSLCFLYALYNESEYFSTQYHICLGCFPTSVLQIVVLSFYLRHCTYPLFGQLMISLIIKAILCHFKISSRLII